MTTRAAAIPPGTPGHIFLLEDLSCASQGCAVSFCGACPGHLERRPPRQDTVEQRFFGPHVMIAVLLVGGGLFLAYVVKIRSSGTTTTTVYFTPDLIESPAEPVEEVTPDMVPPSPPIVEEEPPAPIPVPAPVRAEPVAAAHQAAVLVPVAPTPAPVPEPAKPVAKSVVDRIHPSAPTRLASGLHPGSGNRDSSGTRDSNAVELTWESSTDNVGVTGYRIYRDGALIGTATSPLYSDQKPFGAAGKKQARTSRVYAVTSIDAAGNESVHSESLKVDPKQMDKSTGSK